MLAVLRLLAVPLNEYTCTAQFHPTAALDRLIMYSTPRWNMGSESTENSV